MLLEALFVVCISCIRVLSEKNTWKINIFLKKSAWKKSTGGKEPAEMHLADMSVYGITIFNDAKEIGILDYVVCKTVNCKSSYRNKSAAAKRKKQL